MHFSIRDSVRASPDLGMIRCALVRGAPCLRAAGLHSAFCPKIVSRMGTRGHTPRFPRRSDFLSSELLIWPHRRPPHWDYLAIRSS